MPKYFGTARDNEGNTIPAATVYIYGTGGTTASTIYSESSLTTTESNPMTADSAGNFQFYAVPGEYRILIKDRSGTTVTDDDPVVIGMYADGFTSDALPGGIYFSSGARVFYHTATPEAAITAIPGSICFANVSDAGKVYYKQTGTGNTGWVEIDPTADPTNPTGKTYYGTYEDLTGGTMKVYQYADGTVTTTPIATFDYTGEPWYGISGILFKYYHDTAYSSSENAIFGIAKDGFSRTYVVKMDIDTAAITNSGTHLAGTDYRGSSPPIIIDDIVYLAVSPSTDVYDIITCSVTDIAAANWSVLTTITGSSYALEKNNNAPILMMLDASTPIVPALKAGGSYWLGAGTENVLSTINASADVVDKYNDGFPAGGKLVGFTETYLDQSDNTLGGVYTVDSSGNQTQVTPTAWDLPTGRLHTSPGGSEWVYYNQASNYFTRVRVGKTIDSAATQDQTSVDTLPGSVKPDDFIPVD